jgi:long-chain acyl-CoA synthetase
MSLPANEPWTKLYPAGGEPDGGPAKTLPLLLGNAARVETPLLHYFGTTLTTVEVSHLSDSLAAAFLELGAGPGERIGLYLQNVPQYVIALFAAWKSGCSVVPLNPMLRQRELRYQLVDSGAVILVTLDDLFADQGRLAIDSTSVRAVVTTSELDFVKDVQIPQILHKSVRRPQRQTHDLLELCAAHAASLPPAAAADGNAEALLSYTSGTTGQPKGAIATHGNLCASAHNSRRWFSLDRSDVVLGIAPLFHITGLVAQALVAVDAQAPLVLGFRFDPETMLALIDRYRATFSIGAITAYIALLDSPARGTYDLSSLRKVYSGGAPVAPSIVSRFEEEVGPYIHNAYGLTESSAATHITPFGSRSPVDPTSGALSIGVPIFETVARVVDDEGRDLPPGEVGELVIKGPQVAREYWNRPEETSATFRPDGLRTGDVAFMDEQGWFYLVDRMKDMIIASGYKVWPREVEDVLYEHPAVREAAVVGISDDYRGETVKAVVSLRPGMQTSEDELITFTRDRLAAYKRPRSVEIVDELPKTLSGKILRRELRDQPAPNEPS